MLRNVENVSKSVREERKERRKQERQLKEKELERQLKEKELVAAEKKAQERQLNELRTLVTCQLVSGPCGCRRCQGKHLMCGQDCH